MIQVAKAPNGTFSYVARDTKGTIIILGDECESLDEIRDFFNDLIVSATDKESSRDDVLIEIVEGIDPEKPIRTVIQGIGGLAPPNPTEEKVVTNNKKSKGKNK